MKMAVPWGPLSPNRLIRLGRFYSNSGRRCGWPGGKGAQLGWVWEIRRAFQGQARQDP